MSPETAPYDFSVCKLCEQRQGRSTYKLPKLEIYVCQACSFHYADVLAPDERKTEIDPEALTETHRHYIEASLHSNASRFEKQIQTVRDYSGLTGRRLLDAGCGAGLFMSMARSEGADVVGLDLSDARILYGRNRFGLDIRKASIEEADWRKGDEQFDVVTMWDVLEHVNFPVQFVTAAATILSDGGYLFVDTPRRESFLHRFSELVYRSTGGRSAAFLTGMYSNSAHGHKQILAFEDIQRILDRSGLELVHFEPFKELSLPVEGYLRKFFRLKSVVRLARPVAGFLWRIFPLKNKMLVVARRPAPSQ